MPRRTLYFVFILVLFSRAHGEYEDELQSVFKNNVTRNDFANLLQSLIKLNEQRVNVLQKLYKLEDYGVLSEVLRSGNSRNDNENLKNLFLVVLSKDDLQSFCEGWFEVAREREIWKDLGEAFAQQWDNNQSVPTRNLRRSMGQTKPGLISPLDKKSKAPNETPNLRQKSNTHPGKHKSPSDPTTGRTKPINLKKDNFEVVFGKAIHPKAEKKLYQDRFHIDDGRSHQLITPIDRFEEHDRNNKYSEFGEPERYKYMGREGSHENREQEEHPPAYPHENRENSKAEDERNVNAVREGYGMDDEEQKQVRLSHERFDETHRNVDVGPSEEPRGPELSLEHAIIDLNGSGGEDYDSGQKLNIDIFGDGKPTKSDSDSPDDNPPFPHANLKEYSNPVESRKNLQKCLGKKATKICGKSCISAYKNVCRMLKCTSRSKRALKKECRRSCKKAFATSKYSDEDD